MVLLSLNSLAFFSAYHLLTPSLPLYFKQLGQGELEIGLLTTCFMASSLLIRPWAGRWSDQSHPLPWMLVGSLLFYAVTILFLFTEAPRLILLLRAGQGLGFALFYTASSTFLTQILPSSRRAEGISYHSNAVKLATSFAPMSGLWFAEHQAYDALFLTVLGCLLLSILLNCALLRDQKQPFRLKPEPKQNKENKGPLFAKSSVFPGLLIASNSVVFGALIPFAPLLALHYQLETAQWFYLCYAFWLIASRSLTGTLSDKYGRGAVILPGMAVVILSLFLLAQGGGMLPFLLAASLYGLGAGVVQPSLIAMAADRSAPEHRGAAMATFTLFTDLGLGTGSFVMGYMSQYVSFEAGLYSVAFCCGLGIAVYLLREWRQKKKGSVCELPG